MKGMEGWDGKIPPGRKDYSAFLLLSFIIFVCGVVLHRLHITASRRPVDDPQGSQGTVLAVVGAAGLIGWGIAAWKNRGSGSGKA